tara:strand:- start:2769 stop:3137 length:369 start_codon:yes stop_codon:yes gene_type:complete
MTWFDVVKILTPRQFLESLEIDGIIKGKAGKYGTNMELVSDDIVIKIRQDKYGMNSVNVNEKRFASHDLNKILVAVKKELKEDSYTDALLREAGVVDSGKAGIINVRYSPKKEDEEDGEKED